MFETHVPEGLSAFTKLIGRLSLNALVERLAERSIYTGCDSTVAGQVFKRLEAEGRSHASTPRKT